MPEFAAHFAVESGLMFWRIFRRIFWRIFRRRIFRRILRRIFPWILLGIAGGFTQKKSQTLQNKEPERFSPKNPQEIPAQILPGCGSLLFSGCTGLTRISTPGQILQNVGAVGGHHATMPMLRGMLVCQSFCLLSPQLIRCNRATPSSKAALISIWGSRALPITKKQRAKGKVTKIYHIFTLQIFGHNYSGTEKGSLRKGLFTGGISRIATTSQFF